MTFQRKILSNIMCLSDDNDHFLIVEFDYGLLTTIRSLFNLSEVAFYLTLAKLQADERKLCLICHANVIPYDQNVDLFY